MASAPGGPTRPGTPAVGGGRAQLGDIRYPGTPRRPPAEQPRAHRDGGAGLRDGIRVGLACPAGCPTCRCRPDCGPVVNRPPASTRLRAALPTRARSRRAGPFQERIVRHGHQRVRRRDLGGSVSLGPRGGPAPAPTGRAGVPRQQQSVDALRPRRGGFCRQPNSCSARSSACTDSSGPTTRRSSST